MIGCPRYGCLRADAELHGRGDAHRVADIRTDGAVLVGAVHDLARAGTPRSSRRTKRAMPKPPEAIVVCSVGSVPR